MNHLLPGPHRRIAIGFVLVTALLTLQRPAVAGSPPPAPPVMQAMMAAVVRQQSRSTSGYLHANRSMQYFVSLGPGKSSRSRDLSASVASRLTRETGIRIRPGSGWKHTPGAPSTNEVSMTIGHPVRHSDGRYDVRIGYYCGTTCGGRYAIVMTHGTDGWHVVSAGMNAMF